jgi:hypothetical protein
MIIRSGADGSTRSSENDGKRNDEYAIGTQEYVSGFLGHWLLTRFGLIGV